MALDLDNESLPRRPWLLMTGGKFNHDRSKRQITNLSSEAGEAPALLGKHIQSSYDEWLLLTRTRTATPGCFLLNLFSKETIQLPSVHFSYDFCILSSPPTDPACRVVFFNKERNRLMVCQPVDGKYAEHIWNYDRFPCGRYTIVAGKVYLWCGTTSACLVSLEFEESTYRPVVMEMDFMNPLKPGRLLLPYIVECSGEIFLCFKCPHQALRNSVAGFQIFKADLSNMQWVEVTSIGAHTFFLTHGMSYSVVELDSTTFKANSIYYFNFNVPNLYAYDLGKGVIHMYPIFLESIGPASKFDWIMMPHNWSCGQILKRNKARGWHKKRTHVRMIKEGLNRKCHKKRTLERIIKEEGLDSVWSLWSSLPLDILILIGSYLFGGNYVRFLAVCKSWQLLGAQNRVPPALEQESCSPLLMFQENIGAHPIPVYRFFDPVKSVSSCTEIPELGEAEILYSSEGWLLVYRRAAGCFYFLNPLTQQRIELPRNAQVYDSDSYILSFSSSPTCSNCLVVALHKNGIWISTIKHGEGSWTSRVLEYGPMSQFYFISSPVVVDNGFHYYLSVERDLLTVNLQDDGRFHYELCVAKPREQRRDFEGSLEDDFLVEIDGAPALVIAPFAEGKVRIFRWNKGWKKMHKVDFGDKDMFLSHKSWLLEKTDGGGMGKTIFLPLIDDEDGGNNGIFYSFVTHRYHSFYNGYSCPAPYFVGKPTGGVWVKPVRTRFDDRNLKWC